MKPTAGTGTVEGAARIDWEANVKVFFTGATGVLGREAVPVLVSGGHEVTGVARSEEKARWLESVGARPLGVDLFDRDALIAAAAGHEAIVHMATAIPRLADMPKRDAWVTNDRLRTETTAHLVDAAITHSVPRLVLQSIVFFYADGGDAWITETSPIDPVWDVLDSALAAESEVERFARTGGEGVSLRFGRLYGPGPALAETIESVAARKAPIVGEGDNYTSSLHISDAAAAIAVALHAPPGTYNVVEDEPVRSAEVTRTIADLLGVRAPRNVPVWVARMAAGPAVGLLSISHRVSNQRFKEVTGWRPVYPSVVDGLRAMLG